MEEFIRTLIERLEEEKGNESDYFTAEGKTLVRHWNNCVDSCKETVNKHAEEYNNGWIDVDVELPPNDKYILVSFSNYSLPDIARYEEDKNGGAFYPGDDEKSYSSYGIFVNAWMPLPKQYTKGDDQ